MGNSTRAATRRHAISGKRGCGNVTCPVVLKRKDPAQGEHHDEKANQGIRGATYRAWTALSKAQAQDRQLQ